MRLEEMRVYQIAGQLRKEIHQSVINVPNYLFVDDIKQILRSSSSVPANISEGFGRRYYPKDFIHFLTIAVGSCDETKNHCVSLADDGLIDKGKAEYFFASYKDLAIKINNLIVYLKKKHLLNPNK